MFKPSQSSNLGHVRDLSRWPSLAHPKNQPRKMHTSNAISEELLHAESKVCRLSRLPLDSKRFEAWQQPALAGSWNSTVGLWHAPLLTKKNVESIRSNKCVCA